MLFNSQHDFTCIAMLSVVHILLGQLQQKLFMNCLIFGGPANFLQFEGRCWPVPLP